MELEENDTETTTESKEMVRALVTVACVLSWNELTADTEVIDCLQCV